MAIKSFRCKETQKLFERFSSRRFKVIETTARRKLELVHAATSLNFLKVPPGNRLEALKGDRSGQHSIRINDQFRICFRWNGEDAEHVEIVDYH
jgi:toxin HigB-1